MFTLIIKLFFVFAIFANLIYALIYSHSEMRMNLVIREDSSILKVLGTLFFLPALIIRGALDLLLN